VSPRLTNERLLNAASSTGRLATAGADAGAATALPPSTNNADNSIKQQFRIIVPRFTNMWDRHLAGHLM
jgi:hypothetical protein